jgi:hypothetical protein
VYAGAVAAAECTTAGPLLRSLSTPTDSQHRGPIQRSKNAISPPPLISLLSPPHTLYELRPCYRPPPRHLPFLGEQLSPKAGGCPASSTPDAPCPPPLGPWYLGYIPIASTSGVYSLTCEKAEGASSAWCVGAVTVPCMRALWLLPSAPLPSPSLPLDAHRLSTPQHRSPIQRSKNAISPLPRLTTSHSHRLLSPPHCYCCCSCCCYCYCHCRCRC